MSLLEYSRYLYSILLIVAGFLHFAKTSIYLKIMPSYLPAHRLLVWISGIAEIVCGILLLFPKTHMLGAYLTIALLIAVFPANVEMTRKYYYHKKKGFWLTIIRLPLQILMIWWVIQFIK